MTLEVKPIRSLLDLRRTHDIQRNTWGFRDEMIIPYTQMVTTLHNGGTLLGAYIDRQLVGFVYGYLGMSGGTLYLFSMRMGVLPEYHSQGIGSALKLAQREQMLRQGVDLIVWTYDPTVRPKALCLILKNWADLPGPTCVTYTAVGLIIRCRPGWLWTDSCLNGT